MQVKTHINREVDIIMEAEQWVHTVKDQQDKFKNSWACWMYYSSEITTD